MEKKRGKENIHQKIKKLSGMKTWVTSSNCIKGKVGQILTEADDIKYRWEEYIEKLHHDERKIKPIMRNAEVPQFLEEVTSELKDIKKLLDQMASILK